MDSNAVGAAAEGLSALLSAIDRGEVDVRDEAERAYLTGARDAFAAVEAQAQALTAAAEQARADAEG